MNIFANLRVYAGKWNVKETRDFTPEEIASVDTAVVVPSTYGNSVCFYMREGGQCFLPLATDAVVGVGEVIDLTKAKLVTLSRVGDEDIQRVSI